jgi:nicotinamide mononucleotide (NMN) deamidase PncC
MMFSPDLLARAEKLLASSRLQGLRIATAESCTGGLIAALLTEIAGSSDVFGRGFVTYSNKAKEDMLGVPAATRTKSRWAWCISRWRGRESLPCTANAALAMSGAAKCG